MTHNSGDGGRGSGKTPNYVAKPLPAFRHKVASVKARKVYEQCYRAWRAGVISDFYFGKRSPSDPTIVWQVNGFEYAKNDLELVVAEVDAQCKIEGVVSISVGPAWCGYPSLEVRFEDGTVTTDSYNGLARVETCDLLEMVA